MKEIDEILNRIEGSVKRNDKLCEEYAGSPERRYGFDGVVKGLEEARDIIKEYFPENG